MLRYVSKSILLLFFLVIIVCVIYPGSLWIIGQTIFPFQANGSMLNGPDGSLVGSSLIAQPFSKDEYFQPRPSAASYDASASASSALAASNYALRNRVASTLGPLVKYENGTPVAADIEKWFQQDIYEGKPHIVAQWAALHKKSGKFSSANIPSTFFDMWRQDHPDVVLQDVPGDYVTTSASGLDPHITLQNAMYQLERVANAWAVKLNRHPSEMTGEIHHILNAHAHAPFHGLAGEKIVNVLEVNLELRQRYGAP